MKNVIFTFTDILKYLTKYDLECLVLTRNKYNLCEIETLCYISEGDIFYLLSPKIRNDVLYARKAIDVSLQGNSLLRYVCDSTRKELWNNFEIELSFYLECIRSVLYTKGDICEKCLCMLNDSGFRYLCLKSDGCRLKQYNSIYRCNRRLVEIAITENGNALLYADDKLKNDIDLVYNCVKSYPWAIEYAGYDCLRNRELYNCATSQVRWVKRFFK
tara:strand:+ start:4994 stop:5641 length:648 start_codon:yes stop_codon:yes gene_type:complete